MKGEEIEDPVIAEYQRKLAQAQGQIDFDQMTKTQRDMFQNEQELSMSITQLDMKEEIERLDNLLHGRFQRKNPETQQLEWAEPISRDLIILSEEGVQEILRQIQFYCNKNTLLSNYDEETILNKMEDFATSLSDLLFMRYDIYFSRPTNEEVVQAYEKRLNDRIEQRMSILQIQGIRGYPQEIKEKFLKEVDLEREFEKLRQAMRNDKLKGFDMLMRCIQDTVHSAYLRAYMGQERKTLREHSYITENKTIGGGSGILPKKKGFLGLFGRN
jgi:hypothetical protein